ncbi:MAG: hypothetical protein ABSC95_22380 [Acetobacteraceae bacterium]|jgi:hypothetical protein
MTLAVSWRRRLTDASGCGNPRESLSGVGCGDPYDVTDLDRRRRITLKVVRGEARTRPASPAIFGASTVNGWRARGADSIVR